METIINAKTEIAKRKFNGRNYIELEDNPYDPTNTIDYQIDYQIDYILRWCNELNLNFKNHFEIIRY